ncbi:MAG: hypothetical protein IT290_03605 [Deltaproteobacteria bacterium]|nr:hypothetical protein [Deltaproteobacteria bacterium]
MIRRRSPLRTQFALSGALLAYALVAATNAAAESPIRTQTIKEAQWRTSVLVTKLDIQKDGERSVKPQITLKNVSEHHVAGLHASLLLCHMRDKSLDWIAVQKGRSNTSCAWEMLSETPFSLHPNEELPLSFPIALPENVLAGNDRLHIVVADEEGMTYARANWALPEGVTLQTTPRQLDVVDIATLNRAKYGDVGFRSLSGMTIESSEKPEVRLTLNNISKQPITPRIRYDVYRRSRAGKKVADGAVRAPTIPAGESIVFTFPLPVPQEVQSYLAVMQFVDEKGVAIAEREEVRYVLHGKGATIQDVALSSTKATRGEEVRVKFALFGPPDERAPGAQDFNTQLPSVDIVVDLFDQATQKVIGTRRFPADLPAGGLVLEVPVVAAGDSQNVGVSVRAESEGSTLSARVVDASDSVARNKGLTSTIARPSVVAHASEVSSAGHQSKLLWIVFALADCALLAGVVFLVVRKRSRS